MINREKLTQLSELFQTERKNDVVKDASVLVIDHDEEAYFTSCGKMKRDTICEMFSMTKPITAVAVMILYERGFIDLLDPVEKYLPAFQNMSVMTEKGHLVKAKTPITIAQCMNMTSGLVYPGDDSKQALMMKKNVAKLQKKVKSGGKISIKDVSEAIAKTPLFCQPGDMWHYGISADVLGMIISVVSGMKLSEFLEKEIFEPLGMHDTGFTVPKEKQQRLARMFMRHPKSGKLMLATEQKIHDIFRHGITDEVPFEAGGSGLYSTIDDYAVFAKMLLHKGTLNGRQLLGRKTVEFMMKDQLTDYQRRTIEWGHIIGYGYGNLMRVLIDTRPQATNGSLGEFGWDGMAGTYFFVDKEEELITVYMQQITEGQDESMRRRMRQIIYGAL